MSLDVFLLLSLIVIHVATVSPQANAVSSVVYYKDDGINIDVENPNLQVRIIKTFDGWKPSGRISSVKYKGGSNLVYDQTFGTIDVWNPLNGTSKSKSPSNMIIDSTSGNNTGKLTFTLKANTIVDAGTGANRMNVSVWIKYTFYADFDAIFVYVTIDSSITDWLNTDNTYGQSLRFFPFTSFSATGLQYIGSPKTGILTRSGESPIGSSPTYSIMTLKNSTNNVAVTLFPLKITSVAGVLSDATFYTQMYLRTLWPRVPDGGFVEWGRFMKSWQYGAAWLFHEADVSPFVITPWVMPNAVPYGIAHTYDGWPMNPEEHNKISPSTDTPYTSAMFDWLDENPKRRIDVMLVLNGKVDSYPKNPSGVDGSWTWNGSTPFFNTSSTYKTWLQNLENKRIGYGIHGYHHDSPWEWEFSTVTNTTWIQKTWDRLYADFLTLGLTNNTLSHFKAAGFRLRGQTLDELSTYGVKLLHAGYLINEPSIYMVYVDSNGRELIEARDNVAPVEDIALGKSLDTVYNWVEGNLTNYGFVLMHGHNRNFLPYYSEINSVFSQVESYFGTDLDYFLTHEIVDYWHDVLLPLEYTYNTTTIQRSSSDTRLTFKLLDAPYTISSGLVYTSPSFTLYAPNINTGTFLFRRLSGFAALSNLLETTDKWTFTVSAPDETTSTTEVYVGQRGPPLQVSGAETWSYDSMAQIVTMTIKHIGAKEVTVFWRESTNIPSTTAISLNGTLGLNEWFKSEVIVTLSATDDISGVNKTEYSFNNSTWITYSTPFTISNEGNTTIYFKSTDNVGNVENIKSGIVKIDKTKPTANPGSNRTIYERTSIEFDGSASSDNMGIISYEWNFGDGGTGTGVKASHYFYFPTTYIVTLTVKDVAGNIATESITVTALSSEGSGGGNKLFFPVFAAGLGLGAIIAVATIVLKIRKKKS